MVHLKLINVIYMGIIVKIQHAWKYFKRISVSKNPNIILIFTKFKKMALLKFISWESKFTLNSIQKNGQTLTNLLKIAKWFIMTVSVIKIYGSMKLSQFN